jgi:hypothetical protein
MWVMQQDFVQRFNIIFGACFDVRILDLSAHLDHPVASDPKVSCHMRWHPVASHVQDRQRKLIMRAGCHGAAP